MFGFESDYYAFQHYHLLQQIQTFPYSVLAYPQIASPQVHPISMAHLFLPHSFQNFNNTQQMDLNPPEPTLKQKKRSDVRSEALKTKVEPYQQFSKTSQGAKPMKQKFGRNINSNIFHLMVKFVKKERNLKAKVSKIIQLNKMVLRPSEFYQIFKNKTYKLKSYATNEKIMEFWRGPNPQEHDCPSKFQKQLESARIFRILGRLYLREHHLPYLFNSVKIKTASRGLHLHALRRFAAQ